MERCCDGGYTCSSGVCVLRNRCTSPIIPEMFSGLHVLRSALQSLLCDPNNDSPANPEAARVSSHWYCLGDGACIS